MGLFSRKKEQNPKKSKGKPNARDVPDTLKKYGFRVSTPYGLYPEDVETKLLELEALITRLTKENTKLEEGYTKASEERDILKAEITRLKLNRNTFQPQKVIEVPPTTVEQDMERLAKINSILSKPISILDAPTQGVKVATATSTNDDNKSSNILGGLEIVNVK